MKIKTVNSLLWEILEPLRRKARAAIKNKPEVRALEREKLAIEKGLAAGKYSVPQARELKQCLRVHRQLCLVSEMYRLQKAGA